MRWMTKPKVSVVIATYNREDSLRAALDSVLSQTFQNWEVRLVDDGSTDNTRKIVQGYLDKYKKIHYCYQSNKGVAEAKNRGVREAEGQYITFLDSDDRYKENHLESRIEILDQNPEIELLHGGVQIIGEEYVPDRHNPKVQIHLSECTVGATFFIRPSLFLGLGGFYKMPLGTDADFYQRAQEADIRILKSSIPTYIYDRTLDDSITKRLSSTILSTQESNKLK